MIVYFCFEKGRYAVQRITEFFEVRTDSGELLCKAKYGAGEIYLQFISAKKKVVIPYTDIPRLVKKNRNRIC